MKKHQGADVVLMRVNALLSCL